MSFSFAQNPSNKTNLDILKDLAGISTSTSSPLSQQIQRLKSIYDGNLTTTTTTKVPISSDLKSKIDNFVNKLVVNSTKAQLTQLDDEFENFDFPKE